MTRRIAFIFNRNARQGANAEWLAENRAAVEAVAAGGPIRLVEGAADLEAAISEALRAGCDTVVGAGGDGTLNAVASRLVGTPTAFGVIPLGTLNHFAKDLGIPLDPLEALATIAAGHTIAVDVGEVNGHCFLNNSSIGLYVDVVRQRTRHQVLLGHGKWTAFAFAVLAVFRRFPFMRVTLTVDGHTSTRKTPLVFVGNNRYLTEGWQIGQREGLQGGRLSLYLTERAGRWRLLAMAFGALFGRLRQATEFRSLLTTEVRIETGRRHLQVATDGELLRLATPLRYRIRPGALRVAVPAARG